MRKEPKNSTKLIRYLIGKNLPVLRARLGSEHLASRKQNESREVPDKCKHVIICPSAAYLLLRDFFIHLYDFEASKALPYSNIVVVRNHNCSILYLKNLFIPTAVKEFTIIISTL